MEGSNTKTRKVQELRRSNAAQPHKNKKKYNRKKKHRKANREQYSVGLFAASAKSSSKL